MNKIKNKIVFVAHEFGMFPGHGGIASYLYNTCKYLLENKYEVHVLCFVHDKKTDLQKYENFHINEIRNEIDVYNKLKEINPDYVEVADYLALCLYSLKQKALKQEFQNTVFAVHHHTASRECFEWNSLLPVKFANDDIKRNFIREYQQILLSDMQISPSTFMAEYVKKNYHINDKVHAFNHINVSNNTTKEEILKNEAFKYDLSQYKNSFNIVLFSRIEGRKNQELLVDQFIKFKNQLNIETNLFLAGNTNLDEIDGEEFNYKIYKSIPEQDRKFIHFFDFLNAKAQEKIIAIADLCILPSTFESFSIALGEAILRGIPGMASKHTGCCDYFGNTVKNMTFDPFKQDDLLNCIKRFYALTPQERKSILTTQQKAFIEATTPEKSIDRRLDIAFGMPAKKDRSKITWEFIYDDTKEIKNSKNGIVLAPSKKNDVFIQNIVSKFDFGSNFEDKIIVLSNNDEYLDSIQDMIACGLPVLIPRPNKLNYNKNKAIYESVIDYILNNSEKIVILTFREIFRHTNRHFLRYVLLKNNKLRLNEKI